MPRKEVKTAEFSPSSHICNMLKMNELQVPSSSGEVPVL